MKIKAQNWKQTKKTRTRRKNEREETKHETKQYLSGPNNKIMGKKRGKNNQKLRYHSVVVWSSDGRSEDRWIWYWSHYYWPCKSPLNLYWKWSVIYSLDEHFLLKLLQLCVDCLQDRILQHTWALSTGLWLIQPQGCCYFYFTTWPAVIHLQRRTKHPEKWKK